MSSKKHTKQSFPPPVEAQPVSVKGLIFNPAGQVLVLFKGRGKKRRPDLPGGSPEGHEEFWDTFGRECREETGLDPSIEDYRYLCGKEWISRSSQKWRQALSRLLICVELPDVEKPVTLSSEHSGVEWHSPAELPALFAGTHWHNLIRLAVGHVTANSSGSLVA